MCGYTFIAPDTDGMGRFGAVFSADAEPAAYSCGGCGQPFELDGNRAAEVVACAHCGHQHDFRGWTPADLFGLIETDRPRLLLADEILRIAWCAGVLSLAETRLVHNGLSRMANWFASSDRRSIPAPFEPPLTTRLCLRAFGSGNVTTGKEGETILTVEDSLAPEDSRKIRMSNKTYLEKRAAAKESAGEFGREIGGEFGAVGALIGHVVAVSVRGSLPEPDDPIVVRTALRFAAPAGVIEFEARHDCPHETYLSIPEDVGRLHSAKLMARIRRGFGAAAESYFVLRLLFGPRALPEMMPMARAERIEQCLAARLDAFLPHAAAIVEAIRGDERATARPAGGAV
jgi:DNA-directed RNA polymerase subunit RPC12/RpoP